MTTKIPQEKNLNPSRHHFWPGSLSAFWADANGKAHRISNDGKKSYAPPYNFGGTYNSHHIKLGDTPSPWDENFEPQYGKFDGEFPKIIAWLRTLSINPPAGKSTLRERMAPQSATDEQLAKLLECLISLVVRGPKFRNSILRTTNHYRKEFRFVEEPNSSLVALNQRDCQDSFTKALGGRGKFAVLASTGAEFIFGDGFYHNFNSPASAPMRPRILVPLLPDISIYYSRPLQYRSEPRLMTLSLTPDEVKFLNDTVQVYSKEQLFYRSEEPVLIDQFIQKEFLEYQHCLEVETLDQLVTQTAFPIAAEPNTTP